MRPLLLTLALSLTITSAPARVLDRSTSGFTLENAVTVSASPAEVWVALVDEVGQWWPADHTWFGDASRLRIEPIAGGCFCERDGDRQAAHMTIAHADPGVLLRMLGGLGPLQGMGLHGSLEWRIAASGDGTRITLHYRVGGYSPDDIGAFADIVDGVQAQQLGGLAAHLGDD